MRRCILLLILLMCKHVGAQEPAAPPILVLDSGGHTALIRKVLFTKDGRELITASWDKTIRTWDVASGEPLRVLRPPIGPGEQGRLLDVALSPDGRLLAAGGWGVREGELGWIYILSMTTGRIDQVLKGHTNIVNSLCFATGPDGRTLLASGSWDCKARIWDVATGRCERVLDQHTEPVKGVAFAPDGRRLVTASFDKTARIWSVADGRCEQELKKHSKGLLCAAWSPDGTTLATGGLDRSIWLWRPDGSPLRSFENLGNNVGSIVFTGDSREILYTWGDLDVPGQGAAILDIASGWERVRFAKDDGQVFSGALSPDGALAATASGSAREIYLWRTSDAGQVQCLVGKGRPVWSAGWSPDGQMIAWGHTRKFASRNDRGPLEQTFRPAKLRRGGLPDASYRRALESRGSLRLVASENDAVNVKQGDKNLAQLKSGYSKDWVACFTLVGGESTAIGTTLGHHILFDTRSRQQTRFFESHTDSVWAVAPSPDGRYLLTASNDQTLRISDLGHDEPLLSFFFASNDWIAWTPEGYYAASPGGERLMGWQVSNGPEQAGRFLPASRFHKSLYRPDVIKLLLETGSVTAALERLNEPPRTVSDVLPPWVLITSPDPDLSGMRLDKPELTVRAKAKAHPGHPVTAFRLMLDDRPYEGNEGRKDVRDEPASGRERAASWQVTLDPGRHRLAVVAESDVSNGRSDEVEVIYDVQRAAEPRLYALLIGVADYEDESLRLKYAADDAELLERTLRDKAKSAFAGGLEVRRCLDRKATKQAFLEGLKWLKEVMKPQDVGIIFFSGHGYRDNDDIFYMLPAEVKRDSIDATALDGALLKRKLASIKGAPGLARCLLLRRR